jgi:hypothetical protein
MTGILRLNATKDNLFLVAPCTFVETKIRLTRLMLFVEFEVRRMTRPIEVAVLPAELISIRNSGSERAVFRRANASV